MPKKLAINPCFNNFVFDILYNSSLEEKKLLPKKYKIACKNSRSAQAFIRKSTHEEKQEILSLLGVQWLELFFDRGQPQKKYLRDIFEKYKTPESNRQSIVSDAIKDRIYVTSDAVFFHSMGLMSKIENHRSYTQSLLLSKAGYHVQKWGKQLKDPETKTAQGHSDAADYLVLTMMNTIMCYEYCKELFGVLETDTKILLYLYIIRHTFADYDKLYARFGGDMKKHKITSCLRRLLDSQMIQKKVKDREYSISALGIRKVSDIFQHVLKSNEIQ